MKLKIAYFYPNLLNLYGDNGNVEILVYRAFKRGIDVEVIPIKIETKMSENTLKDVNFLFMGGGPDSSQHSVYSDLIKNKATYINGFVESGGVSLLICGAYQLFGHYYKAADGSIIEGLSIFDMHTEHFGNHKPRCIGNMVFDLNTSLEKNELSESALVQTPRVLNTPLQSEIVGFENHGGRTYLGKHIKPLGKILKGFGNNGEDQTEGAIYKNSYGTYSHGPLLSKNPHFADYLLSLALKTRDLVPLDDNIIYTAHKFARDRAMTD